MKSKRIYLDYAASTPVAPEVFEAMKPYFGQKFGNAGSLHSFGQEAQGAIDKAREMIAKAIGAQFREIIFTGSATEANNLALQGAVKKARSDRASAPSRIIISAIEHESVLETAKNLEKEGIEVIYIPVDKNGYVSLKRLEESLNERTILVSVMYVNNEIGTVQPIAEISKIISEFRERGFVSRKDGVSLVQRLARPLGSRPRSSRFARNHAHPACRQAGSGSETLFLETNPLSHHYPLFHTDAVQAFQFFDCDVRKLGVDLITLSAHKIYGPKGIGVLYVRDLKTKNYQLKPLITGGGQEFGMRSGTENVPAIVGFGKAAELVFDSHESAKKNVAGLKGYFWQELKKIFPQAEVNGQQKPMGAPHILNVHFPGNLSQDLLIKLDIAGVAVSSGAACSARSSKPSHVLKALNLPIERIRRSLRFSFGRFTKQSEIDEVLKILKKI